MARERGYDPIPEMPSAMGAQAVADRFLFVLDEGQWQAFGQALSRPATEIPGLRELLASPTLLDQADDGCP